MKLRLPFAGLLIGAAALTSGSASAQLAPPEDSELRYGVSLYHYYQQEYLPALSELMLAEERGGIDSQGKNPQLIEGGIRLAFGMPETAAELFEQVLAENRTPAQRAAAWFYLGKLHYLRAEWSAAEQYLQRADVNLAPGLKREQRALQINLDIRQSQAPSDLEPERKALGDWTPYALYNLASAQARAGNHARARAYYQSLVDYPLDSDSEYLSEHLALRDKAHTGAGYSYLLEGNYSSAINQFLKVRLDHGEANQALLGYGWAALEAGDYREALKPWQALAERPLIYAPVQEALLAVPHAYERLDAPGEALDAYDQAEGALEGELLQIESLTRDLSRAQLLAALEGSGPGAGTGAGLISLAAAGEHNWLTLDRTSVIETHSAYLVELFQQNPFQVRVQALRDLLQQRGLLAEWLPKLEIYAQLQRDKKTQRGARAEQLARNQVLGQADLLKKRRDQLAENLARVAAERDYMALADDESRELYQMALSAQQSRATLEAAGRDTGEAGDRLRLYQGILIWRAAQEFPKRLWHNQKTLNELDTALAELSQRSRRVREITETDLDIEPALARIERQAMRVQVQLSQLDQALDAELAQLSDQVSNHLVEHRERLQHYLARARLAAARLQDQALREQRL